MQAIRERLDEQRVLRQEQEREEEQEAESEAQEQQAQVNRQAVQIRARIVRELQQGYSGMGTGCSLGSSASHICLSFAMW